MSIKILSVYSGFESRLSRHFFCPFSGEAGVVKAFFRGFAATRRGQPNLEYFISPFVCPQLPASRKKSLISTARNATLVGGCRAEPTPRWPRLTARAARLLRTARLRYVLTHFACRRVPSFFIFKVVVMTRLRRYAKTHKQPVMAVLFTHARGEAVAAERAGGERGWLFAGQKANRVHPSIAAASEAVAATMRRRLNAGRWNLKEWLQTGPLSLRKRQKGSGEKRRAFPRMGAKRLGCGAGLGIAKP